MSAEFWVGAYFGALGAGLLFCAASIFLLNQRIPRELGGSQEELGEAIEWESLDGLHRTMDKSMAENWAPNVGVRVIRRANKRTEQ